MITQQDINTVKDAMLRNLPPNEKAVGVATFNILLHTIGQLERLTVAFEKIASK